MIIPPEKTKNVSYKIYEPCIALLLVTHICVLIYMPYYLIYNLPTGRAVIYRLKIADNFFENKEYLNALRAYSALVDESPTFKYGIKRIVCCSFSLIDSDDNQNYFILGVYYLSRLEKLDKNTLEDVRKHLRPDYNAKLNYLLT